MRHEQSAKIIRPRLGEAGHRWSEVLPCLDGRRESGVDDRTERLEQKPHPKEARRMGRC